jgi:hypothetical protein
MATVTTSSAAGYNRGKQNCYTQTTDQFGKTVFESPGQSVVVEFPDLSTPTGANITIATGGTISLDANITYEISHRVSTVPSLLDRPGQAHVLYNVTAGSVIYPYGLMGETNTVLFTPDQTTDLILLAVMPDGVPPNTLTQPFVWQYPQQIENSQISIVQVGGETA